MRRKSDIPLKKHTLNLYEGEIERLQYLHGRVGAGRIVRDLVHNYIKRVEERAATKHQDLEIDP